MSIIKGLQNFVYKTLPERLKKEALLLHPQKSEELLYCAKYWQDCAAENILKPLNRDYVSLHGQLNGINHFFITGANPQNLSQKFMNTGLMPKEMISLSDMEFKRLKPIEAPITAFRCIGEKPDFFSEYKLYQKRFNIRKGDIVFVISNSGRNPLCVEIALAAKEKGAKVVAITALEASKTLTAKHSSGKKLYEVADYILDNCTPLGDCCIDLEGFDSKVIGLSMITTSIVIQATMYRAMQMMIEKGEEPKVYQSQNIDGMREKNEALEKLYADRLNRI